MSACVKKSTMDSQQKIEEMKKAVEELQKLLKQANDGQMTDIISVS